LTLEPKITKGISALSAKDAETQPAAKGWVTGIILKNATMLAEAIDLRFGKAKSRLGKVGVAMFRA
jgi:hypothetical protein